MLSAQQALAELKADAGCGGCDAPKPLRVTAATLSTGAIETSRGTAQAPVWEFAIEGTAVRVTRLAVADHTKSSQSETDGTETPNAVWFDSASGEPASARLTVYFTGAPATGDKPCGEDYAVEAVESSRAVAVIVIRMPNRTPAACSAVGAPRSATVTLATPLGDRTVLDVALGRPVATVPRK